jgi:hypothetical protein
MRLFFVSGEILKGKLGGIGSCVSLDSNFWSSCSFAFGLAVAY